jgi:isopenicillin-N epimerase
LDADSAASRAAFPDPHWGLEWGFSSGVAYLNHGSFGPPPRAVRVARDQWTAELDRNPMDFFVRRLDELLEESAAAVARFVGGRPGRLAFVPNATAGMNIVADSCPLQPGDEVLLSSHEYGAVQRIWRRRCAAVGAEVVAAPVSVPLTTSQRCLDELFTRVGPRTRLLVLSHVTSPTAVVFPVAEICRAAREIGLWTCIDGPHALAMRPLALDELDCDFYCASGHKWLSAPFGSGFLYVRGDWSNRLRPTTLSWGRSLSGRPSRWQDEFHWSGTHQPAAWLSLPAAIQFLERVGLDAFRATTHALARHTRQRIVDELHGEPVTPDDAGWYGSMATVALPWLTERAPHPGATHALQQRLWRDDQIEVPLVDWDGQMYVRVSCHLYTRPEHIDRLIAALRRAMP